MGGEAFETYRSFCSRLFELTGSFPPPVWPPSRPVEGLSDDPLTESAVIEEIVLRLCVPLIREFFELAREESPPPGWYWFLGRKVAAACASDTDITRTQLIALLLNAWLDCVRDGMRSCILDSDRSFAAALESISAGRKPEASPAGGGADQLRSQRLRWRTVAEQESFRIREAIEAGNEAADLSFRHQCSAAEAYAKKMRGLLPLGLAVSAVAFGCAGGTREAFGEFLEVTLPFETEEELTGAGEALIMAVFDQEGGVEGSTPPKLPNEVLLRQLLREESRFSRCPALFLLPRFTAEIFLVAGHRQDLLEERGVENDSAGSAPARLPYLDWVVDRSLYLHLYLRPAVIAALEASPPAQRPGAEQLVHLKTALRAGSADDSTVERLFESAVSLQRTLLAALREGELTIAARLGADPAFEALFVNIETAVKETEAAEAIELVIDETDVSASSSRQKISLDESDLDDEDHS